MHQCTREGLAHIPPWLPSLPQAHTWKKEPVCCFLVRGTNVTCAPNNTWQALSKTHEYAANVGKQRVDVSCPSRSPAVPIMLSSPPNHPQSQSDASTSNPFFLSLLNTLWCDSAGSILMIRSAHMHARVERTATVGLTTPDVYRQRNH